jgi:GntR family transcriptional regulator
MNGGINRQSKLPLYQQLYEVLRAAITRGEWKPGDMIPAESELIERFGVSRITVRQVLDMLVREELIYRERGRGSFVSHPTVEQMLQRLISFTDDMRQRGFEPSTRLISSELLPAPEEIARALRVPTGEELARIVRLRLADGEPMSVEESYLVHSLAPGVLELDVVGTPLREQLDRQYGIRWERAHQTLRAVNAPRQLAQALGVKPGAALLAIERVSFTPQGAPVEFLRIYHRGDRYSLSADLKG